MAWYVKRGDRVKAFDKLCEVQSDKATVEITSRFDGVISALHHKEGDIVKVGSALVDISTDEVSEKVGKILPVPAPSLLQSAPIQTHFASHLPSKPFILADIGEGIAEVELMSWYVKVGDQVKAFDKICEVQSDKATVEITSRYDGIVTAVHHQVGNIVKVGTALVDIQPLQTSPATIMANATPGETPLTVPPSSLPAVSNTPKIFGAPVLTTPAVRKIAKEHSIDLNRIEGTGPKGRVLKEDVLNFIKNGRVYTASKTPQVKPQNEITQAISTPPITSTPTPITSPPPKTSVGKTVVPIRGIQRLMVKSMTAALDVPHMGYCEEIIVDPLISLRKQLKEANDRKGTSGVKLSYMPFILKATSLALLEFPTLNATVNSEVTEMTLHGDHNIGVAMDTPKGLIVPVLKEVQNMSIIEIAKGLSHLQDLASKGALTEAHLSGGTFALSNIGSIGGTYASPIIVVPQVAIGALGRFQIVPRYVGSNGSQPSSEDIYSGKAIVSPTTIMNISWSADHRVIDGATLARFSNTWKSYLENPSLMLGVMK